MKYLNEKQETRLRVDIDGIPDRRALRPGYPPARARGAVTLPSGVVIQPPAITPAAAIPRTRIFPFYVRTTLNARNTISFPKCLGPGVIAQLHLLNSTASDPPIATIEIGYALAPVAESAVALTVTRPYVALTELQDPQGLIADADGVGYTRNTVSSGTGFEQTINYIVTDHEFFPTLSTVGAQASGAPTTGYLRVVENIPADQLLSFM